MGLVGGAENISCLSKSYNYNYIQLAVKVILPTWRKKENTSTTLLLSG